MLERKMFSPSAGLCSFKSDIRHSLMEVHSSTDFTDHYASILENRLYRQLFRSTSRLIYRSGRAKHVIQYVSQRRAVFRQLLAIIMALSSSPSSKNLLSSIVSSTTIKALVESQDINSRNNIASIQHNSRI
jgi:hypothetical protein